MMKSPWKKKTKKIPVVWNPIPRYDELVKALDDSYRCKAKNRMILPVISFIKWHNDNSTSSDMGWLLSLLQSGNDHSLALLSYFCYGTETVPILLKAINNDANDHTNNFIIPGFQLFKEKLLDAPLLGIENGNNLKSMLLTAVRNSYYFNGKGNNSSNNKGHPVSKFLSVINKQHGNGWLFNLGNKKTKSRTYRDKFLATALYNIIGGGCKLEDCDILASALGSKANSPNKRKAWIQSIARDTTKEIMEMNMNNNSDGNTSEGRGNILSVSTATTAPTAALTALSGTIVASLSSTAQVFQSERPPSLITQSLDPNIMPLSPLTGTTQRSVGNFFAASPNGMPLLDKTETVQYKTPSKKLSKMPSSGCPTTSVAAEMSCDNDRDNNYDPLNLSFGLDDDDSPAVALFQQKLSRSAPSPAWFASPSAQPMNKRGRRSSIISPDRFSLGEFLSPKKHTKQQTPKEKLLHCLENSNNNNNNNDDDVRAAAITYLFGEDSVFERLESMEGMNAGTNKKLLSDAINFISKNTNSDGSISNRDKTFVQVTKPKPRRKDCKPASYKKYIKRKSADVKKMVGALFGNNEEVEKDVLAHVLINDYNQVVFEKEEGIDVKISALDVLEVRNRAGFKVGSSVVTSIMKDTTSLLIRNNKLRVEKSPFEGQLRKKIGQLEKAGTVPSTFEYVECYVTQDNVSTCTYYYIEDVPLLIELLVAGCIMEGRYEESIDISILNNKIIMRFGCDRGGGDLIMGISLANRNKGNSGRYAIPIGVVESATEVRSNLEKTVYSKARRAILEQLVNQHLFMVRLYFYEEDGVTLREVKCVLLRFNGIGIKRKMLSGTKFVCSIDKNVLDDGTAVELKSKALGRSVADEVLLNTDMFLNLQEAEQQQNAFFNNNNNNNSSSNESELHLTIQLVKVEEMYVGCRIIAAKTTEEIFSFEFDNQVDINKKDSTNISGDCLQLIGVPSEDGKMCDCVYGLSTCGASHPCPKCDWGLKDNSLPLWMKDFGNNTLTNCKEFTPRTGNNSRDVCHESFKKIRGERTDSATVESKKSVLSVVNEPLLHIDDDLLFLHNGEPMHVSQGCMTHLTKQTATQLELLELDGEDDFISKLTVNVEDYIQSMDELQTSNDHRKARSAYNKADRSVKAKHKKYKDAVCEGDEDDVIDNYFKQFEDSASRRDELGEQNGYISMMKRIQGGLELKSLMIVLNKSKKKNFNKAAYIFMKAVKTFAGDFNKGHGVHELTNALGIRALEKRREIYDAVINGCNNSVDVARVMNWWLECANLLYDISIMIKTQDKVVEEDVCRLKDLVVDYVYTWTKQLETYIDRNRNPIFWKMHMLCCGLIEFVEKTGMAGRCSAEGFENKHYVMNQIKRLMAPIALDKLRCEKLSQRQQSCLIPGIADVQNFFQEMDKQASSGIRGPYKSRGTRTKLLEDLPLQVTVEEEAEENYFVSSQGNLIPDSLADIYVFMIHGKVPDEWSQTFQDNSSLGTKAANAAPYI